MLNARQTAVLAAIAIFAVIGAMFATRAESGSADRTTEIAGADTTEAKILRAMSAGPQDIARLYAGESERDRAAGDVR